MSGFDWAALEERGPDCPAEFDLERLHLGLGEPAQRSALQAHVDGCEDCAAHMARLGAGFDIAPEVDERALLAGVRRRMDEAPRRAPWWRWLLLPALAAAGFAVWSLRPAPPVETVPDGPRFKGGLAMTVHRQVGLRSEQMVSGDRFAPGDRLRLVIDLPLPGRVAVWGLEAGGAVYRAWPFESPWVELPAGRKQALPEALELDDALGREVLGLVFCPGDRAEPTCEAADGLVCAAGCEVVRFELDKR